VSGRPVIAAVIAIIAATSLANGLWMVAAPLHWYHNVPAGVPAYGPFNDHFVRDIGLTFVTMAAALWWAMARSTARFELVAMAAAFFVLHAGLHAVDTARGHLAPRHWLLDLPGVYLPAVLLVWVAWTLRDQRRR
jgi:hypothetical protein